ncbi:integrin beta pat-3-like isoform X1 [Pieris brassicae]|uniref:Integrin beta n=2 Tax=Pieris brassicae TaxID=7116 RepID=A0A9P0WTZ0_PIEBR|nr:integrin beta pat-3-like isoform X1 [Pieris brassicae]CAH3842435.1 unnamed protein product [Pieris brassicae]
MKIILLIFCVFYAIKCSYSCEKHLTCEGCIRDANQCIWCALDNYNGPRCMTAEKYIDSKDWCIGNTINPNSTMEIGQNKKFSSEAGHVIQIKPQSVKIKLRPGQQENFEFSFKNADNYPVDLYFLMDGSTTMKAMKDQTRDKSENIYKTMKSMSTNVLIGMGTFVDKNTLPYTTLINSSLAYSFRHRLKLTHDFKEFQNVVNSTEFGLNYDTQEGTLDALAQVMVCNDLVGWRKESRKIIIVLTDSTFHAAGDGGFGGISQPFDGKCHSDSGYYSKELELDYPSISIINKLAADEEISVIFAVNNDNKNIYKTLTEGVSGSKCVSFEQPNVEDGMPTILKSIYKDITSQLKLRVNMNSEYRDYFNISFNPDCISRTTNSPPCKMRPGGEKKIKATIKLLKYFPDKNISIGLVNEGIREELTINVEMIESCGCKREENSSLCSSSGTKRCGICECNEGSTGDICQCKGNIVSLGMDTCRQPGSNKVCNGLGDCVCGSCICKERFKGKFCECNEDSCPRGENGLICSNLGTCDCGTCRCNDGWSRPDCSCPTSVGHCSDGDVICNNRGKCECGLCICEPISQWDARHEQNQHCHISPCPSCHILQCQHLESCALCHLRKKKCDCSHFNVKVVSNITESWAKCPDVSVDVGCYTQMVYRYASDRYGIDVIIQSELNCAKSHLTLGGIVLVSIILLGILICIIYKYITKRRDQQEVEKFEKKLLSENFESHENPNYQPASTKFENPTFGSEIN